ncbi:MoaD/ThiS family protein [Nocardia asteroides]|uniref:Sulfur carrier protein n=1 Tax=Nocardia asteroides NBRC 15531 TaxID=1110697 RepID=U5E8F6_NOCAS|nr:MoaD/ThiS family protein [Nocardia asteroides]TLF62561.1 MoaD/ThiS family protein [Nocardia asteroides NBRC 15531]UGT46779.1 MoaD/ThiS family protein [Nocardia asteroides]SFN65104.1 molybdopterin synthase subunit MoaD [Nocardia asteroides]VEG34369.1 9.5 kDa culture filtrate antigen cfp10A [Nocardia asteroides]GAD81459.1 putative sulfur carrier protein [Nocardia asteroides NBRC 15531]
MARVLLPSALRPYADGAHELDIEGPTLRDVLDTLRTRSPALERRLRDERGTLRRYVNFYIDGDECRTLDGVDTPLSATTELMIIPAVAGG